MEEKLFFMAGFLDTVCFAVRIVGIQAGLWQPRTTREALTTYGFRIQKSFLDRNFEQALTEAYEGLSYVDTHCDGLTLEEIRHSYMLLGGYFKVLSWTEKEIDEAYSEIVRELSKIYVRDRTQVVMEKTDFDDDIESFFDNLSRSELKSFMTKVFS